MASFFGLEWPSVTMREQQKPKTSRGWHICGKVTWWHGQWKGAKFFTDANVVWYFLHTIFPTLRLTRPLVIKISSAEDVVSASWTEDWVQTCTYRSKMLYKEHASSFCCSLIVWVCLSNQHSGKVWVKDWYEFNSNGGREHGQNVRGCVDTFVFFVISPLIFVLVVETSVSLSRIGIRIYEIFTPDWIWSG